MSRPLSTRARRWLDLSRPGTLVVLDFDGTLAPIVRDREDARLSARTRAALGALALRYPVAILSGRGRADVAGRVRGLPVRWVVGCHGAEWPGRAAGHRRWRARLDSWRRELTARLSSVKGVEIEDKGISLSVHYRAAPRAAAEVARAVAALAGARTIPGKRVWNVLPEGAADKGSALRRLARVSGARRVLFVGDDATDEAAFREKLPVPVLTVRVGHHPGSAALHHVKDRGEVDALLEQLARRRGATKERWMGSEVDLGPVLGFMQALWALEQGLNQRSKAMLRRHGVTGPQRLVLLVTARAGPIAPGKLAQVLRLHPASVTRLAATLERRGMIRRRPHPEDGRQVLLELGPKGKRIVALRAETVESAVTALMQETRPADLAATERFVRALAGRLGAAR